MKTVIIFNCYFFMTFITSVFDFSSIMKSKSEVSQPKIYIIIFNLINRHLLQSTVKEYGDKPSHFSKFICHSNDNSYDTRNVLY